MSFDNLMWFLSGSLVTGLVAAFALWRVVVNNDLRIQADPLLSPPSRELQAQVESFRQQVALRLASGATPPRTPDSAQAALICLSRQSMQRSVWFASDGELSLPDGTRVPIRSLVLELNEVLVAAYRALDMASALVVEYADLMPARSLEVAGQPLHGRRFAFEEELLALAKVLGLDSDRNGVAHYGGAELLRRVALRRFSDPLPKLSG